MKPQHEFIDQHGLFARAAWLIDNNQHTEAMQFVADYYGLTSHSNVFRGIMLIQSEEGEMPQSLIELRTKWTKRMKSWTDDFACPEDRQHLQGLL